jgi:hypothetical protein
LNKIIFWIVVISLLTSGCLDSQGPVTPSDLGIPVDPTETVLPVLTPTPLLPVGVLLTPEGSDPKLAEELSSLIGGYIRELDLRFQVLSTLTAGDFENEIYQIVVVIPPFAGITELASSHPGTKFLAVGFNDLEPAENLTVLRSGGGDFDIQGFAAGYMAALITDDWRVGVLSVQENENALAARDGFRVGVKYFCGLCNPKYAPTGVNYIYPKYIDLPVDAPDLDVNANLDFLIDRFVNTFYIVPGVGTQNIYRTLVAHQKLIIGSGSDFDEEYRDYWVASLEYDLIASLTKVWPMFLEAEQGFFESSPLLLTDINPDLLSEGKTKLVYAILEEVSQGYIQTSFEE